MYRTLDASFGWTKIGKGLYIADQNGGSEEYFMFLSPFKNNTLSHVTIAIGVAPEAIPQ